MRLKTALLLLLCTASFFGLQGQSDERRVAYKADLLRSERRNDEPYRLLVGDVVFRQEETVIYCDSSLFFHQRDYIEAFGRVKIYHEKDTIYGDELYYHSRTPRKARLRQNVHYQNHFRHLYTDTLNYDVETRVGGYLGGATLRDEEKVLTSLKGRYQAQTEEAFFYQDVVLRTPRYTLFTDTLYYLLPSEYAKWWGGAVLHTVDADTIRMEAGRMQMLRERFTFDQALVTNDKHILMAELLRGNEKQQQYHALQNVSLQLLEDSLLLFGHQAEYGRAVGGYFTQQAWAMKYGTKDTLFLTADTLRIRQRGEDMQGLSAYHRTALSSQRFFARCDSLHYDTADSVLHFYQAPILWYDNNQVTADSIILFAKAQKLDKAWVRQRAFLISQDSSGFFNQLKGRSMDVYFRADTLHHMDVTGNAESIYFVMENDSTLMGMNRLLCGEMSIDFQNNQPNILHFYIEPEGTFFPTQSINSENSRLNNFAWRPEEKPSSPRYDPGYWKQFQQRTQRLYTFLNDTTITNTIPDGYPKELYIDTLD